MLYVAFRWPLIYGQRRPLENVKGAEAADRPKIDNCDVEGFNDRGRWPSDRWKGRPWEVRAGKFAARERVAWLTEAFFNELLREVEIWC